MAGFRRASLFVAAIVLTAAASCSPRARDDGADTVRITGSDTMLNLTLAWAEAYNVDHPNILIILKGGGSGVGIANLCAGRIELAIASRPMKPKEIETAVANTGKTPKEFVVGRDALALYVNRDNPLDTISIEQLAEIYGAGGKINTWSELGVDNKTCSDGEIIRISRQNSSGTFVYFQESVLGKGREYKPGYTAQSGSSDVVALVATTPCAIGYSGMGYRTDQVKVLKIAPKAGAPGVEPSVVTAQDGTYPISRPLYFYTLGEPTGATKQFIDWVQSPVGQRIVEAKGYVPMPESASK